MNDKGAECVFYKSLLCVGGENNFSIYCCESSTSFADVVVVVKIKVLSLSQHDPSLGIEAKRREERKKTLRARPICCQPVQHTCVNLFGYIFIFLLALFLLVG